MKRFVRTLSAIATLAIAQASFAGRTSGPGIDRDVVPGHTSVTYHDVWFRGGELALVTVNGDGDSDLDVYVYDENGHLVAKDDDLTDDCIVTFGPRWTGRFTIQVVNRGDLSNAYTLRTN